MSVFIISFALTIESLISQNLHLFSAPIQQYIHPPALDFQTKTDYFQKNATNFIIFRNFFKNNAKVFSCHADILCVELKNYSNNLWEGIDSWQI